MGSTHNVWIDAYLVDHPHATNQSDPNFSALTSAENAAGNQLAQANSSLSQAAGSENTPGWVVKVIDPPSAGIAVGPGKKKDIELILAGVLGGALIRFLGVVALTPAKKDAWEDEIPQGGLMSRGATTVAPLSISLVSQSEESPFASERQFILRRPAADAGSDDFSET